MVKRLVLLALCAALLLPHSARAQDGGDPMVDALREAGLITDLNLSQTNEDITATLNWAYADVNQFLFELTIAGTETRMMPSVMLTDAAGNIFSQAQTYFTSDTSGALVVSLAFYPQTYNLDTGVVDTEYFQTQYGDFPPPTLDLFLSLQISETLSFNFEFTVDLFGALKFEPNIVQSANGVDMTLQSVKVTPSKTDATVCFNLPTNADWQPEASLVLGDQTGMLAGWGMTQRPSVNDVARCFNLSFNAFSNGQPATLTLTVDRLRLSEPETREYWEAVRDALLEYGIEIEVVMEGGVYYNLLSQPEGMTEMEAATIMQQVRLEQRETTEGPWVFSLELSQPAP